MNDQNVSTPPAGARASARGSITTTQIGAIGEHIAASQLMLASQGRLSPFLPMADDDGIDLLIFDKVTRSTLPIQIKSRTGIDQTTGRPVQFAVSLNTRAPV